MTQAKAILEKVCILCEREDPLILRVQHKQHRTKPCRDSGVTKEAWLKFHVPRGEGS
jgi:hypothetical protein